MKLRLLIILICLGLLGCQTPIEEAVENTTEFTWGPYRGMSVAPNLEKQDIYDLAAMDANFIRLAFASEPMMDLQPPYQLNQASWAKLDSILSWCSEVGIEVLIDPHRYPGMNFPWTMLDTDPFWKEKHYQDLLVEFWEKLAQKYGGEGHPIAGYDLLNEPALGNIHTEDWDINPLYDRLIQAIRKHDTIHPIVIAAPRYKIKEGNASESYAKGMRLLKKFDDPLIVYQIHMYSPMDFSHQDVFGREGGVGYPGTIEGVSWDEERIAASFEPAKRVIDSLGAPMLVGEFSVPRWVPSGNRYLEDIISYCENEGWSWSYHAYRESHIWDPEMSPTSRGDSLKRYPDTPRLGMLKSYFKRNKAPEILTRK